MWELLEEQGMTADQLMEKLEAIDLGDGSADGQVRQLAADCRSCGSKVAAGLSKCQFCGADVRREDDHPMDQIG